MYGKLYESTYTGSMVGTGAHVFAVWGYVIANTQPDSMVEINPVLVSAMIGEDVSKIQDAIDKLCAEDPRSRSKKHQGRRLIKRGEFIYFVPNYLKYRGLPNDKERKQYFAQKQRERRERLKETPVKPLCQNVSKPVKQAEAVSIKQKAEAKDVGANGSRPASDLADLEKWLLSLMRDPTYAGINIKTEYGKMLNWCKVHGKQPTQRRFVNWINRAERPISSAPMFNAKPKLPAPTGEAYKPIPPPRDVSDAEFQTAAEIAKREVEKLRQQLK